LSEPNEEKMKAMSSDYIETLDTIQTSLTLLSSEIIKGPYEEPKNTPYELQLNEEIGAIEKSLSK